MIIRQQITMTNRDTDCSCCQELILKGQNIYFCTNYNPSIKKIEHISCCYDCISALSHLNRQKEIEIKDSYINEAYIESIKTL